MTSRMFTRLPNSEKPSDSQLSWLTLAVCCLVMFMACVFRNIQNLPIYLGDSDDALRLVQVRSFIAGNGWYDMHIDKLAPPEGYVSHWSRIPDAFMFVIHWFAAIFAGDVRAEFWMRALYPGLWIVPAFLASVFMSHKIVRSSLVTVVVLLLIAGNYGTFTQFLAGRIDHHGAQISLAVVAIGFAALSQSRPAYAALSGVFTSLCLGIGLEALLLLIIPPFMLAVRYAWQNQGLPELRAYLAGLAISILAALAITFPPSLWLTAVCDAIAANLCFGIAAGASFLLASTYVPPCKTNFARRMISILASGVVAAGVYTALNPNCLHGPFAEVAPALRVQWLDNVNEMAPVISFHSFQEFIDGLPLIIGLTPCIPALFWLLTMPKYRNNFAFLTIAIAFVVSLILGVLASRSILYCIWLAAPVLCAAAAETFWRLGPTKKLLAAMIVCVLSPTALGTGLLFLLSFTATVPTNAAGQAVTISKPGDGRCNTVTNFDALSKLPPGLVLADFDLGSHVLALTHHQVYAASYHRIGNKILDTFRFFGDQDLERSRAFAQDHDITYVLVCSRSALPSVLGKHGLYEALLKHQQPDWLIPVVVADGNPIEVYQVRQ